MSTKKRCNTIAPGMQAKKAFLCNKCNMGKEKNCVSCGKPRLQQSVSIEGVLCTGCGLHDKCIACGGMLASFTKQQAYLCNICGFGAIQKCCNLK